MRVAYVTPHACGTGHAVRGVALLRAASRVGVELRAFGPRLPDPPLMVGYEGSDDWPARVIAFVPDLLIGDLSWVRLDELRQALGVPAWLLMRWMPPGWLRDHGPWRIDRWERRMSIEPSMDDAWGITDCIPPVIVDEPRFRPTDGQELHAGYNTYWESVWFGYRDRVRWLPAGVHADRSERLRRGGDMNLNGADVLMGMLDAKSGG